MFISCWKTLLITWRGYSKPNVYTLQLCSSPLLPNRLGLAIVLQCRPAEKFWAELSWEMWALRPFTRIFVVNDKQAYWRSFSVKRNMYSNSLALMSTSTESELTCAHTQSVLELISPHEYSNFICTPSYCLCEAQQTLINQICLIKVDFNLHILKLGNVFLCIHGIFSVASGSSRKQLSATSNFRREMTD